MLKKLIILTVVIAAIAGAWLKYDPMNGMADHKGMDHMVGDTSIDITIRPDPPSEGENTLKLKLTDPNGEPINNAAVHLKYTMPPMGSMPAMGSSTNAVLAGDSYQATISLSMAGTWYIKAEINIPDKPSMTLNFRVTTGVKGITAVSGASGKEGSNELPANAVQLTDEEEQAIGVVKEKVAYRRLHKEIRTVGIVAFDPELYVAEEEYLGALRMNNSTLIRNSVNRLKILGLSDSQIRYIKKTRKIQTNLILPENKTWIYLTIYEYELGLVKEGLSVVIDVIAYPGETFPGRIASISPVLDEMTRSVRARAEVKNPGKKLKPRMYANAVIKVDLGRKLSVPDEAVIDTGTRKIIVVAEAGGNYFSRDVKLGLKGEGYYEVLEGLKDGDEVVTSGNFLIDSESRLRSAAPAEQVHKH